MSVRILEADKGGFIVVFEGHGIAAKSSWEEVLSAIEEAGFEHMGLEKPEPLPSIMRPQERSMPDKALEMVHSFIGMVTILGAATAALFAVQLS
jgi:hypothetical protein